MSSGLLRDPQHIGGDVEAHLLRVAVLETVGADLRRAARSRARRSCRCRAPDRRRRANSRAPPAAGSRRWPNGPPAALPGSARGSALDRAPRRSRRCAPRRSQSAPRKPRKSGANGKSRGMSGASSDPLRPTFRPSDLARSTKPGMRSGGRWSSSRPLGLVGRVDHHAMEAVLRRRPAASPKSGSRSANSTAISFVRAASGCERLGAGGGIAATGRSRP